jgi:hypothetical protein
MLKKFFTMLCFTVLFAFGLTMQVSGADHYAHYGYIEISPLWANTELMLVDLEITNGAARMSGLVLANIGTESITVTATLSRVNPDGTTSRIASFSNLRSSGSIWAWERTHFVARGHYYRLTLMATVVRNGISELVTLSHTVWAN